MLPGDIGKTWLIKNFVKKVSTRKKKNQERRQISQLDETLNDFVIGNNVNVNVLESENLEQQCNDFERVDDAARQNQTIN